MAQSSNYKQFARGTRVLTEESGFAGGMLWTGNNIDATHLKSIVNFDYDDTTGYLKTRDPLVDSESPVFLKDSNGAIINLKNHRLIGVHTICPLLSPDEPDEPDTSYFDYIPDVAGTLYLFGKVERDADKYNVSIGNLQQDTGVSVQHQNTIAVFKDYTGVYYVCDIGLSSTAEDAVVALHNTKLKNLLTVYDNFLYGLGSYNKDNVDTDLVDPSWMQVFCLVKDSDTHYSLRQLSYNDAVLPRINDVTLLEASRTQGYNAGRGTKTFAYTGSINSDDVSIVGAYLTDNKGEVVVSPRLGQKVSIIVPVKYKDTWVQSSAANKLGVVALFQLKEGGSSHTTTADEIWQFIDAKSILEIDDTGAFRFDFRFQKTNTTLGIAYYGNTQIDLTATEPHIYSEDAIDILAPYTVVANDSKQNVKIKNYDLSIMNSNCVWNSRICLWSTTDNTNCLFLSEVDNPYYYPIPCNVAVFDNNIINCIPYKDSMLVFTTHKIYRMTENNDGTFTQTVVQNNMPLSKVNETCLTAIKNMVLFKSGDYFYMIVPKSQSLTDELSVAPIYKNIAGLLNTMDKSVLEILQLLYPEYLFTRCVLGNDGEPTDVYAEQDTLHILYNISTTVSEKVDESCVNKSCTFKLFLNYNTNLRAWTLYVVDTTDCLLEVATLTAAQHMSFIQINHDMSLSVLAQQHVEDLNQGFRVLLDTGYRTLSMSTQKRFREVQLKIYNTSENLTSFGTSFLVDGVWRRSYSKFQETTTADNTVSLMPTLDMNTFITELSMPISIDGTVEKAPGSDSIELSDWCLNFSHFKRGAPITVRVPVSGKGFNPRFILMAPKALNLYINEVNWVYRLMHGR